MSASYRKLLAFHCLKHYTLLFTFFLGHSMGLSPLHSQCCWLEAGQGSISKSQRTQSADRTAAKACLLCVQWCFHCFTATGFYQCPQIIVFSLTLVPWWFTQELREMYSVVSTVFITVISVQWNPTCYFFNCLLMKQNRGGIEMLFCYWLSLKSVHFSS